MKMGRQLKNQGFTLIELVVVIAVIAILAAVMVPTILGQAERARVARAKADVTEIAKSFGRMKTDTGFTDNATTPTCYLMANLVAATAPGSSAPFGCKTAAPNLAKCDTSNIGQLCWNGPYMAAQPGNDPWGTAYAVAVSAANVVSVTSLGSDGASGGTGDAADITVSQ